MQSNARILLERPVERLPLDLSVSKAKTYKSCAAKYKFAYIEKLPKKDRDYHIFGKFLHEVLENFHRARLEGNLELDHILMTQCFKGAMKNWSEKMTADQKKECWEILSNYLKVLKKQKGRVIEVEKPFYIDIDQKILLNGYIDRIQIDEDQVLHVADYKTSKKDSFLKKDLFQLLTYAFVLCLEDPTIEKVRCSYIMLRHNFKYITKNFLRPEIMKIEEKFLEYAQQINQEKLWRPTTSKLCEYCEYLANCGPGKAYVDSTDLTKFGSTEW